MRHRCNQIPEPPSPSKASGPSSRAIRPDAGLREFRVRRPVLFRVRCAAPRTSALANDGVNQVPLAEQRRLFVTRWRSLMAEMQAA